VVPSGDEPPVPAPAPRGARPPTQMVRQRAPVRSPLVDLPDGDGTPNYLGLSLREALTQAHAAGWDVDVDGWGYVTAQRPLPGAEPGAGRRLALTLSPDGAAAPR
jgi:hypothetical protein